MWLLAPEHVVLLRLLHHIELRSLTNSTIHRLVEEILRGGRTRLRTRPGAKLGHGRLIALEALHVGGLLLLLLHINTLTHLRHKHVLLATSTQLAETGLRPSVLLSLSRPEIKILAARSNCLLLLSVRRQQNSRIAGGVAERLIWSFSSSSVWLRKDVAAGAASRLGPCALDHAWPRHRLLSL